MVGIKKTLREIILLRVIILLKGIMLLFILWELFAILLDHPALPEPWKIILVFGKFSSDLWIHLIRSGYRILMGIILALLIGIPIGIGIGYWGKLDKMISSVIYLIYPIPKIAFLPLVLLLFGLGDFAKIFLIGLILVFQIIVVTRDSVKSISAEYFYSIRSLGANEHQIIIHLIIPAILPNLFTALRLSIGTAIAVLFFAETFATYQGLGYYIFDAWTMFDYERMFIGIIGLSILGLIYFSVVDLVEQWVIRWK